METQILLSQCRDEVCELKARLSRYDLVANDPISLKKEGDIYIAGCFLFDTYSQGATDKEALYNLREALILYVSECINIKLEGLE